MDGLKQRIIGALVLVSLAVIFVPMIFDEPHSERTSTSIQIPEEPPFPEVEVPATDVPEPPVYRIQETEEATSTAGQDAQVPTNAAPEDQPGYRLIEAPDTVTPAPPKPAEEPAAKAAESRPEPDDSPEYTRSLEGAWVVQLGSFGNADNARRLRDQVREMGYGSHLQEVVRGDTTLTRVFSGPFADKSEAEAAKKALDNAFKLNSLVTAGDR